MTARFKVIKTIFKNKMQGLKFLVIDKIRGPSLNAIDDDENKMLQHHIKQLLRRVFKTVFARGFSRSYII